jgi:hypothetical protein
MPAIPGLPTGPDGKLPTGLPTNLPTGLPKIPTLPTRGAGR